MTPEQAQQKLDNWSVDDFCGSDGCNKCGFNDVKAAIKIEELLEAKEVVVRAEMVDSIGLFKINPVTRSYEKDIAWNAAIDYVLIKLSNKEDARHVDLFGSKLQDGGICQKSH